MCYGFRVSGYGLRVTGLGCKRKRIGQDTYIQEGSHPGSGELGQPFSVNNDPCKRRQMGEIGCINL